MPSVKRPCFAVAALLLALFLPPAGPGSADASIDQQGAANTLAAPTPQYAVRGVIDRDFSATGFNDEAAVGFNFIDTSPYAEELDPLAARGLKGFVWLGGYSNDTCAFKKNDDWIRSHVGAIAENPAVGAYLLDDEPDAAVCPGAPAQMKARSDLVKSLDPGPTTFVIVYKNEQFALFAGTVDVLALDKYPCSLKNGCDYSKIDDAVAEADRLGVRYWAVIQAHGDDWYKVPSPDELHQQFLHWRASRMEGYIVFAWHWPDNDSSLWLANHPELQAQLDVENQSPPDTRITSAPRSPTSWHRALFRFRSTEPESRFRCKLDSREWRACTSPKVYRGLASGRHTFRVRARDAVGNVDPTPALHRWRIR
jgi:hypothetical protein